MKIIQKNPLSWFVRQLFPSICLVCRATVEANLSDHLCPDCLNSLVKLDNNLCFCCGTANKPSGSKFCQNCTTKPSPFLQHRSCYSFSGPITILLHQIKFNGDRLALAAVLRLWQNILFKPAITAPQNFYVLAVPAHPDDIRRRGFDLAFSLAKDFSKNNGFNFLANSLIKKHRITPQKLLSRAEREKNVLDLFCYQGQEDLGDQASFILIDDIYTTGATLRSAASAIKQIYPRAPIYCLTLARVDQACPNRQFSTI